MGSAKVVKFLSFAQGRYGVAVAELCRKKLSEIPGDTFSALRILHSAKCELGKDEIEAARKQGSMPFASDG